MSIECKIFDPGVLVAANIRLAEIIVDRVIKLRLLQDVIGHSSTYETKNSKNPIMKVRDIIKG